MLAMVVIAGCATPAKTASNQTLSQYPDLSTLAKSLETARSRSAGLLAPESYLQANESFQSALSSAEKNDAQSVQEETTAGLKSIGKLNKDIEVSNDLLSEVLQARERAHAAGVKTLEPEKILALDKELRETAGLIEEGNYEKAKKRRPELLDGYSQLELKALKLGTANLATSSIRAAKEQDAQKNAPKTLARAEESLALAVNILENDRTQTDKANQQAGKARWLAEQSAAITETIKDFERRDYTQEDIVLWHQQQLLTVNEALASELAFNKPDNQAVQDLRAAIFELVRERDAALANSSALQQKYVSQTESSERERQLEQFKEREYKRKFELVQALFKADEANVYLQRENILISAHGFQFASGQSEIQTVNFPLMSKIIQSIKNFPGAYIQVSGHTDSLGEDGLNQAISEARASNVTRFLIEVGGIKAKNISSRGYGESRPVASNETRQGRAENRRVEIKIINK